MSERITFIWHESPSGIHHCQVRIGQQVVGDLTMGDFERRIWDAAFPADHREDA